MTIKKSCPCGAFSTCKSQNQHNSPKSKNNTSGLKGAYFRKDTGKWFSAIMVNRKSYRLGQYETAEEAHDAYRKAAIRLHGEFARAN
ncbi:hypothetical protein [Roseinatronobacter sp. NSM]|uniref:hypothetical protein n=1 Tax=Roseinatronobacter sp. NSM TaxID=3457785 RepID=UPI0040364BC0